MATVRKGVISFGLVSIPVQFYVGARSLTVGFNQLHVPCKSRIQYKVYCPTCERNVERSEILRAYKLNGYVAMDDADFASVEQATSRAVEVLEFVNVASVDPIYFETSYYLGPQKDSERPYFVLVEALRQAGKAAVVRFVMGSRQHHALIRAAEEKLLLHTLYYADEVRELLEAGDWKRVKPAAEEVDLARQFIEALSKDFEAEKYHDEYRERLTQIIRAKAEGEPVALPAAPPAPAKVINLMEALRRSVDQVKRPPTKVQPGATAAETGTKKEAPPARQRRRSARAGG